MKKLNILSFIFMLTSVGLLATNIDFPKHKYFRNPTKVNEFGATESKKDDKDFIVKRENMVEMNTYASDKFYKRNNLNYNNAELFLKDLQAEAIKNSNVVMLTIVSKE